MSRWRSCACRGGRGRPESDYWYWDYVQSGSAQFGSRSYTIDVPSPVSSSSAKASLTVVLQGATATDTKDEHHIAIALNGVSIGESKWQGATPLAATFAFDPSLLVSGQNQVDLVGVLDSGVPYSVVFVNAFDLTYPRAYQAEASTLAFTADNGGTIALGGFSSPQILLYNVADPRRPRIVTGSAIANGGGAYRATFGNARRDAKCLALTSDRVLHPADVRATRGTQLRTPHNGADYVVIASTDLRDAARALVDYRSKSGLRATLIDLQDIYDEFNAGITSPWAIRPFLSYAQRSTKRRRSFSAKSSGRSPVFAALLRRRK